MSRVVRVRLGDRLLERGVVSPSELEVALGEQRRAHRPLGKILVSLGFASEADVVSVLAEDLGLAHVRAADLDPDPEVVAALDAAFVRETHAFPYALEDGVLRVVMVEPDDPGRVAAVRARFPYPLDVAIATESDFQTLVRDHLRPPASRVGELFALFAEEVPEALPVDRLVHALLEDGVGRGATDVHVEPEERVTRVRYRVDGILVGAENLPAGVTAAVVSRIKVLANLDISERRRPQDGRLRLELDGRVIDVRVSVVPCPFGENVVLRLLDARAGALALAELGVSGDHQRLLAAVARRSHGLFLVTGPTGSGKTTTLFGMLGIVDAVARKVATIEDPIEYRLPLLRQSQVDPGVGFGFHEGLRAILRQDPDVILVGEIRDGETADMAVKAATTGHLVLATLHTNSALGAIPRLLDLGVEPFLLEDVLVGTLGQRLVRKLCASCRAPREASREELAWLGAAEPRSLWSAVGCERCRGSGYRGRTALVELFLPPAEGDLPLGDGVELAQRAARGELAGHYPMQDEGRRLVGEGTTTVEEVERVHCRVRLTARERAPDAGGPEARRPEARRPKERA